ncbi:MAG: DUF2892 domain-containing protein [Bacteroidetes bacterium]|nr:DUF2892 domain-containing protein [Bacteroidota bacterium]
MKCNMGKTDRTFRFILGTAMVVTGAYYQSWWALAGLVPLLTAATRWCPVYVPFNINTGAQESIGS